MSIIHSIYKRFIKFKVQHSNPEKQIEFMYKYLGIKVGKNFRLLGWPEWGSEPYLIEIGDNVTLSQNIVFHTHDGGVGLFRNDFPGINIFGRIVIGNNVFIGANSTILASVNIGDNVVIGAGSMVTKDIQSNGVFAGVPVKFIRSLEEYKERSLQKAIYIYEKDKKKRKEEILRKLDNS